LLIELLIVVAIIGVGFMMYTSMNGGASPADVSREMSQDGVENGDQPQTMPGRVKARAAGVQCLENLRELRAMVTSSQAEDGSFPATLADVPGSERIRTCPVGREAYIYDASTGKVNCPHPGHDTY